ncbi:hypothetical protein E1263_20320 [Kribbella antibiotica]|uniref:Uncharacterized protein n=1 Tax=Kribbella antibiotica TaxID=190195 RepID=A0A4R4ZHP3_9ACTN|nr:hypothetical protein [Kribbella antibiotica]TDD58178.1 hypothetical protein E1263_20320 [Kribbella antibiotica]
MNDRELDRLIARANPYGDDTVRQLPTGGAESDLLEDILTTTEPATRLHPGRRRRLTIGVAAAVSIAAAVAVVGAVLPKDSPVAPFVAPQSAYAAEVRAIAEANERILINDPAWKITVVDEFTKDRGEMKFANGDETFQITWYPAKDYKLIHKDRVDASSKHEPAQVLGQQGTFFLAKGSTSDFSVLLPPKGAPFVELRTYAGTQEAFQALLTKLKQVDVETWLNAMPETVVRPEKVRAAVDEMLTEVTVPKGFKTAPLYKATVIERYQLGARVTGAASCAWLDQWTAARKSGDKAKAAEAVTAMQGSKSWKILKEMDAAGDYPESIWNYADEIAGKKAPESKSGIPADGYQDGLGCR